MRIFIQRGVDQKVLTQCDFEGFGVPRRRDLGYSWVDERLDGWNRWPTTVRIHHAGTGSSVDLEIPFVGDEFASSVVNTHLTEGSAGGFEQVSMSRL